MASKDYEWFLRTDMSRYKGKYVIIRKRKVVYSGENLKILVEKFRKRYSKETPLITKIPKDEVLILVVI